MSNESTEKRPLVHLGTGDLFGDYRGHTIADSNGLGGKAGRGCNRTATVQVRKALWGGDYLLLKQVRYSVDKPGARQAAAEKARAYIDSISSPNRFRSATPAGRASRLF